jgi:hypothetical protein
MMTACYCHLLLLKQKEKGDGNGCRHLFHYNITKENEGNNNKLSSPYSLQ